MVEALKFWLAKELVSMAIPFIVLAVIGVIFGVVALVTWIGIKRSDYKITKARKKKQAEAKEASTKG